MKFYKSIEEAFVTRNNTPRAVFGGFNYFHFIHLVPSEIYLQYSDIPSGIAFDQNYKVEIVNPCNDVLSDITNWVNIQEFTDLNGLQQIAFEVLPLTHLDFGYDTLLFKFTHTVSSHVWYTNPFILTYANAYLTSRLEYRNFEGRLDYFQSIRLNCYFWHNEDSIEVGDYFQISTQRTISDKPRMKLFEKYKFESLDNFTLSLVKRILLSDILYLNGVRVTNKPLIKDVQTLGSSNLQKDLEFLASIDGNDTRSQSYQINELFGVVSTIPINGDSLGAVNDVIYQITFNKLFTKDNSKKISLFKDGVFYLDLDTSTFTINGFKLEKVDTNLPPTLPLGNYRIEIEQGAITSIAGESLEPFEWRFSRVVGDFNSTDFLASDFLTN